MEIISLMPFNQLFTGSAEIQGLGAVSFTSLPGGMVLIMMEAFSKTVHFEGKPHHSFQ